MPRFLPVLVLFSVSALFGQEIKSSELSNYEVLSEALASKSVPGLIVLDVRTPEEYAAGHIPGAVKIDWHTDLNDPVERDYIDGGLGDVAYVDVVPLALQFAGHVHQAAEIAGEQGVGAGAHGRLAAGVEELAVLELAGGPLDVAGPLEGHGFIGAGSDELRDRGGQGLEVEEMDGELEDVQGCGKAIVDPRLVVFMTVPNLALFLREPIQRHFQHPMDAFGVALHPGHHTVAWQPLDGNR